MKKVLFKNGQVVSGSEVFFADVLVEDGKIKEVVRRENVAVEGGKSFKKRFFGFGKIPEIDCTGKFIFPGLIDVHVHFRDPGQTYKEDFSSGSKAAISGGVTTVFDMPNNIPPTTTVENLEKKRGNISKKSYVNFGLYMGFDGNNIDEINDAEGICGVKTYVANSTGNMGVNNASLEKLFEKVDRSKLLVFHAEDEGCINQNKEKFLEKYPSGKVKSRGVDPAIHSRIRAKECALMAVETVCELAKKFKRPIHICHVSSLEEVSLINEYREFGVTCEITLHHLFLSDDDYEYLKNFIKVNPPVRSQADVFGLWKALQAVEIDMIATDHAPHTIKEKKLSYLTAPSGVPGVEVLLPMLLTSVNDKALSLSDVARLCCERPAEVFGVQSKGKIAENFDADIVVVDMEIEKKFTNKNVVSKCLWSPYAGCVFKGLPVMTFVGGELIFKNGKLVGKPKGKEVKCVQ
ncbi:MAG: dihydroorotase [Candidatus Gracilibacteria bacterium]